MGQQHRPLGVEEAKLASLSSVPCPSLTALMAVALVEEGVPPSDGPPSAWTEIVLLWLVLTWASILYRHNNRQATHPQARRLAEASGMPSRSLLRAAAAVLGRLLLLPVAASRLPLGDRIDGWAACRRL